MIHSTVMPELLPVSFRHYPGGQQSGGDLLITSLPVFLASAPGFPKSGNTGLEILWINEGNVPLLVNGENYIAGPGTVCVLPPASCFPSGVSDYVSGYHLYLSTEMLHEMERGPGAPLLSTALIYNGGPLLMQIDESIKMAEEIIWRMQGLLADLSIRDIEILRGYMKIFLLYISRTHAMPAARVFGGHDKEMVEKFLTLVRSKFTRQKMVADYAAELCVTASYLNRVVKRLSGFTASHHIQQQIILEAKRLCRHGGKSMKEIAYGLGFNDIAHFSKFFKNYTGANFTSFKRRTLQVEYGVPVMASVRR